MKTAIFSLNIGNHSHYLPCLLSMKKYAKKYEIDYYISTTPKINYRNLYFEKFQAFDLYANGYDRILYCDADVLVTPNAANIFTDNPDPDIFYAYHENTGKGHMDRNSVINKLSLEIKRDFDWPKRNGVFQYFNAGIFLPSKKYTDILFKEIQSVPDVPTMWEFGDQTCLNYAVAKASIPFESLDYMFNRMDLGEEDLKNKRYESNFIHYAGPCKYGQNKWDTIRKDYEYFYGKIDEIN